MRFVCDDNLGKLAKYLRILGFDTLFQENISDPELMRLAASQERFLLTRDHHLIQFSHPYGILLLDDDDSLGQLAMTIISLGLIIDPELLFQRCSRCNEIALPVDMDRVKNQIFPFILRTQNEISRCPSCGRFYWKGSHYTRLLRQMRKAIPDNALAGPWPGE